MTTNWPLRPTHPTRPAHVQEALENWQSAQMQTNMVIDAQPTDYENTAAVERWHQMLDAAQQNENAAQAAYQEAWQRWNDPEKFNKDHALIVQLFSENVPA